MSVSFLEDELVTVAVKKLNNVFLLNCLLWSLYLYFGLNTDTMACPLGVLINRVPL